MRPVTRTRKHLLMTINNTGAKTTKVVNHRRKQEITGFCCCSKPFTDFLVGWLIGGLDFFFYLFFNARY